MSSQRFNQLVNAAYKNNDLNAARDAYEDWQNSHCLSPKRIRIVDSHTQKVSIIKVDCGECEHCRMTKINEWTTRMYAHAEDFKHVYFVTLTYRSISNVGNEPSRLLLQKLSQAVWHCDNFNSTKHMSFSPCLLCKDHYQKFLKRLRKNTRLKDLTYVVSGEYGSNYGRPHFHLVLFTSGELTYQDVRRAWSVALWRGFDGHWEYRKNQKYNGSAFNFPIGQIDFNDLVSNGTFNTSCKIKVDGQFMNAANCFAYVCKYVCKQDAANFSRVNLAYRNLYRKGRFVHIAKHEVEYNTVHKWLNEMGYTYSTDSIQNLKSHFYEKIIYDPQQSIYAAFIQRSRLVTKNNYTYPVDLLPSQFADFRTAFRPFCEFSRGCPIGSLYAKNHIHEFAQGIYKCPLLQSTGFVVPSYFRSKAQDYLYGIRKVRKTIKSTSLVFSGLVDLQGQLQNYLANGTLPRWYVHSCPLGTDNKTLIQSDRYSFADKFTGERIIMRNDMAECYKYSRTKRDYTLTRAVPLADYIRAWCVRLQEEQYRFSVKTRLSLENELLENDAFSLLDKLGERKDILKSRYIHKRDELRNARQKLYDECHKSAE